MKEYNKVNHVKRELGSADSKVEEVMQEELRLQKVTSKPVKKVKRGIIERGVVALIGPDGLPKVSKQVFSEVVGPAIKNMAFDALNNGLRMLIFKDDNYYSRQPDRYGSRTTGWDPNRHTNYGSAYRGSRTHTAASPRKDERPARPTYEPGQAQSLSNGSIVYDYTLESREDATRVLDALRDNCYKYGKVKVANYYELIGIPTVYTDNNFGWLWDDIEHVRIRPARGEFVLELPPVTEL